MSYEPHPAFTLPPDLDASLWRYMRFARLLSMLQTRELFFARADRLGDPFEGSYSRANLELKDTIVGREHTRELRERSCISCWHMNPAESAAMWRLYGASDHAVAVRSTTRRLLECLRENRHPIYVGVVNYIDYDRTPISEDNLYHALLHKRLSFEHEREVRAITSHDPRFLHPTDVRMPDGVELFAEIEVLVEAIYVAPDSPQDLLPTVGRAVADAGFPGIPVRRSRLGEDPLF